MKIEELHQTRIPTAKIDKKLDRFKGRELFPEKLEKANRMLSKSTLPKIIKDI